MDLGQTHRSTSSTRTLRSSGPRLPHMAVLCRGLLLLLSLTSAPADTPRRTPPSHSPLHSSSQSASVRTGPSLGRVAEFERPPDYICDFGIGCACPDARSSSHHPLPLSWARRSYARGRLRGPTPAATGTRLASSSQRLHPTTEPSIMHVHSHSAQTRLRSPPLRVPFPAGSSYPILSSPLPIALLILSLQVSTHRAAV